MMEFRIWVFTGSTFIPTEYWAKAARFEHIELDINKAIRKIGSPCIVVTTEFKNENHES